MDHILTFCAKARDHAPADGYVPDALRAVLDTPDIYSRSLDRRDDTFLFLARLQGKKVLIVEGAGSVQDAFAGETAKPGVKVCETSAENAAVLRELFPYTAPRSLADEHTTFGTGDRLGIATPGHVMAVEPFDAAPVLAQQSCRELNLCGGRTFQDVVDRATWGVFERHFTRGYGADGDHLKTDEEITRTLAQGASMLTLDACEHIDNDVVGLVGGQIRERYLELPARVRKPYEKRYLDRFWEVRDVRGARHRIEFDDERLAKAVLVYYRMVEFAIRVYQDHVKGREIDFEISIDETLTPTDSTAHFLIANELIKAGVEIWSLAPRFCGEFQKGIDYIGDQAQFEDDFRVHSALADYFGYKLSIHSGSDKFSVFPTIGRYTKGRLHHKTAGTSWLEAMRVVAQVDPALFREMYAHALDNFEETRPYYHVNGEPDYCPAPDKLGDADLPELFEEEDPRQIIHCTYGVLLQAKGKGGKFLFRDRLFQVLDEHEQAHYEGVAKHITRHLDRLGIERI